MPPGLIFSKIHSIS